MTFYLYNFSKKYIAEFVEVDNILIIFFLNWLLTSHSLKREHIVRFQYLKWIMICFKAQYFIMIVVKGLI